jgi:hypothetical protein
LALSGEEMMKSSGYLALAGVFGLLVACSSGRGDPPPIESTPRDSSTGNDSGSTAPDGGSNGDGDGGSTCALPPGEYTIKYTNKKPSEACLDIEDGTVEVKAGEGPGIDEDDREPDCTYDEDFDACTFSYSCEKSANGFTTTRNYMLAIQGDTAVGTSALKMVNDQDGTVVADCEHEIEITKN